MKRAAEQISESKEAAPEAVKPLAALEAHSLSDMDFADEHTTEHEEDLGAESSELDEGEGTDAPPSYPEPFSGAGRGTTLTDFAKMAQRQVNQEPADAPQVDTTTTSLSTPWHWGQQSSPQKQGTGVDPPDAEELQQQYSSGAPAEAAANSIASDTNAAHVGAASVSFLDECSLNASECDAADIADDASPSKVVIEQVPKELQEAHSLAMDESSKQHSQSDSEAPGVGDNEDTVTHPKSPPAAQKKQANEEDEAASEGSVPLEQGDEHQQPNAQQETTGSVLLQQSIVGASIADTSAARLGDVSFVNSPDYAPTEDEDESAPKILVDKLPLAFEQLEETPEDDAIPVAAGDESKDESRSSALPDQKSAPEHTSPDPPGEKDGAMLEDSEALGSRQEASSNVVKEKYVGAVEGSTVEPEALPAGSKVDPPKEEEDDASGDDAVESAQKILSEESIGGGLDNIEQTENDQEDTPSSPPKRDAEPTQGENDGDKSPAEDEPKHKAANEVVEMNEEETGNSNEGSKDEAKPTKEIVGGYGDMEEKDLEGDSAADHGEDRDSEMQSSAEKSEDELKTAESGDDEATDVSSRPPLMQPAALPAETIRSEGKLEEEDDTDAKKEAIETALDRSIEVEGEDPPAEKTDNLNQSTPKSEKSGRSSLDENITLSELGTRASGQNNPPAVAAAPTGSPASPTIQANKGKLSRAATLDSNSSFNISSVNILVGSPGVSSVATSALGGSPGRPAPKIPFAVREANEDADSTDDEDHAEEEPKAAPSSKRQRAQGEDEEGEQILPSKKAKQDDGTDYSTMTNKDLKDLCRKRKLAVSGNKAALTGRLRDADKGKDGAGRKSENNAIAAGDNDGQRSQSRDTEDKVAADEKSTQSQSMGHSIGQTASQQGTKTKDKSDDERALSPGKDAQSINKEKDQEGKDEDQMEESEPPVADSMEDGDAAAEEPESKQPTSVASSTTGKGPKKQEEVGGADEKDKRVEETRTQVDYSFLTKDELKDRLRKRNLKVGGSKADLVVRLENDDASATGNNDGAHSQSGKDEDNTGGDADNMEDDNSAFQKPASPTASRSSKLSSKQPTSVASNTAGRGPKKQEEVGGADEKDKQVEETASGVDYDSMTQKELRKLCKERNLKAGGSKADLVLLLENDDASATGDNDGAHSQSGHDEDKTSDEADNMEEEDATAQEPESPAASRSSKLSSKQPTSVASNTAGRVPTKQEEVGGADAQGGEAQETATDVDYSSMTVIQLRELLREKNLSIQGSKADLIRRLEKGAESNTDASPVEDNEVAESGDAKDDTGNEADNMEDENAAAQEPESPAASRSSRRSSRQPTSVDSSTKGRGRKKQEDVGDGDQKGGEAEEKTTDVDYDSMTRPQLRILCNLRSLKTSGSREDLVARLQNDDASDSESSDDEDDTGDEADKMEDKEADKMEDKDAADTDYNSMTQLDLRKLLKKRNLRVGGSKADLVARLQNDDASATGNNDGAHSQSGEDEDDTGDERSGTASARKRKARTSSKKTVESDDDKSVASNASDVSRGSKRSRTRANSNADEEDAASASTEATGRSKRSRKKTKVGAEDSESEDESKSGTKSTASSSRKKRKPAVKSTKAAELPPIPEEAEGPPPTASPGKGRKKRTTRNTAAGDTDDDASTAAGSTTSSVRRSRRAKMT